MIKKKILLVGYSGHANFGDDLLLYQAYEELKEQAKVSIWTNVPREDAAYLGSWFPQATIVQSQRLGWSVFRQYNGVMYIGGGVFFDYTQPYPFAKYLKKRIACFKDYTLANLSGVKFAGIGIGLGPFLSERAKNINSACLANFDFVSVRDEDSWTIAKAYGLKTTFHKGFDLSFYSSSWLGTTSSSCHQPSRSILVCPRKFPHGTNGEVYHQTLIRWCIAQQQADANVLIFGFQRNHDEPILERYDEAGLPTKMWNPSAMEISDVFALFARQDLVISARMHGVYVAGMVGTPCIGINVHPKVKDAASILEKAVSIEPAFTEEQLAKAIATLAHRQKDNDLSAFTESALNDYTRVKNWVKYL